MDANFQLFNGGVYKIVKYIILCSFIILLANCNSTQNNNILLNKLSYEIEKSVQYSSLKPVVCLKSMTNFSWDSVYVFHSEESADFISAYTGIKWTGPSVPNLNNRLLFTDKGQIISYVDYFDNLKNMDSLQSKSLSIKMLTCPDVLARSRGRVFSRAEACFVVAKASKESYYKFFLIPVRCQNNFNL